MSSGWLVLVVAPANKHTWYPGRATTFEAPEATLQALLPPDEPADELLSLLLLLVQAATPSPSIAATTADVVTLPTVLTRVYPLLMRFLCQRNTGIALESESPPGAAGLLAPA